MRRVVRCRNKADWPERGDAHLRAQKGLTPPMVEQLDRDFSELVLGIEKQLGTNFADVPRAGAAGGLGYGIMTFLAGKLVSGFEYFSESAKLREHVIAADVVVTGEGKLDNQTLQGKGPFGVAALARACGKPVYVVAGSIEPSEKLAQHFTKMASLVNESTSLAEALRDPEGVLYQRARALFEN